MTDTCELAIPHDLQNIYYSGGHCSEHEKRLLIERIARLEQEKTMLREALEWIRDHQTFSGEYRKAAQIALKATEGK